MCRFHVELHFSPGVNCCVAKNGPEGPGFRPNRRSDNSKHPSQTEISITDQNNSNSTEIDDVLEDENPVITTNLTVTGRVNPRRLSEQCPPSTQSDIYLNNEIDSNANSILSNQLQPPQITLTSTPITITYVLFHIMN